MSAGTNSPASWPGRPYARIARVNLQPEYVFAILALAAGLFMAFATPPFQAPDEDNHFMRAFQLSQGDLFPLMVRYEDGTVDSGGILPTCLRATSEVFMRMKFRPAEKVSGSDWRDAMQRPFTVEPQEFTGFQNTAIYPPVSYLPQVVGIWVTRPFGLSPLVMMYAGRLLNLLCWTALVFLAIRRLPAQKWVAVMIAIMPMSLFLAASLSGDPMTNGMSMLFVAMVAKATWGAEEKISTRQMIAMVLLASGLAVVKLVYLPLVALLLLIPAERLRGVRRKAVFCAAAGICAAVVSAAWSRGIEPFMVFREWTDPNSQIAFVLENPAAFLGIVVDTILSRWPRYFAQLVGVLGWLDTFLPVWIYASYLPILILAALVSGQDDVRIGLTKRAALLSVCLLAFLLLAMTLFVMWTRPGLPFVDGIQGRYFIPLVLPLMILLYNRWRKCPAAWMSRIVTAYCVAVLLATCLTIADRYYG